MTALSPAARAVLSAYISSPIRNGDKPAVAAVLRTAAYQMQCAADTLHLISIADELDQIVDWLPQQKDK